MSTERRLFALGQSESAYRAELERQIRVLEARVDGYAPASSYADELALDRCRKKLAKLDAGEDVA